MCSAPASTTPTISSSRSKSPSVSWRSPSSGIRDRFQLLLREQLVERREIAVEQRVERSQLRLQPPGQLLEHGERLIGRPVVAGFDEPLQRRELVVQADREVQRILAAA